MTNTARLILMIIQPTNHVALRNALINAHTGRVHQLIFSVLLGINKMWSLWHGCWCQVGSFEFFRNTTMVFSYTTISQNHGAENKNGMLLGDQRRMAWLLRGDRNSDKYSLQPWGVEKHLWKHDTLNLEVNATRARDNNRFPLKTEKIKPLLMMMIT